MLDKKILRKEIHSDTNRRDFLKKFGKTALAVSGGIGMFNFLSGYGNGKEMENSRYPDKEKIIGKTNGCDNRYLLANLRNWKPDYHKEDIRRTILASSSIYYEGMLFRYRTPILIYTGGIWYFDKAVNNIEVHTGELINFERVDSIPKKGIVVLHRYSDRCGEASWDYPPSNCKGELSGRSYAIRDDRCGQTGDIGIAVTEHQIMHCLGLHNHFDGFKNGADGGIKDIDSEYGNGYGSFARAVLMNMYQNPPGTKAEDVKVPSY